MNGYRTDIEGRQVPRTRRRTTTALIWTGWAALVGLFAWVEPTLGLLLALVVGIAWLRWTDADPVHWGPVPRPRRRTRPPTSAAGRDGTRSPVRGAGRSAVRGGGSPSGLVPVQVHDRRWPVGADRGGR